MFNYLLVLLEWLKAKIRSLKRFGILETRAFFKGNEIEATIYVYLGRKLLKCDKTSKSLRLKPGKYVLQAVYMQYILEKDVEIEEGITVKKEFRFPGGVLECKAYEGTREIKAIVEIKNTESGEVVAKRATPFTIHLEVGKYTLRAIYTPTEGDQTDK